MNQNFTENKNKTEIHKTKARGEEKKTQSTTLSKAHTVQQQPFKEWEYPISITAEKSTQNYGTNQNDEHLE